MTGVVWDGGLFFLIEIEQEVGPILALGESACWITFNMYIVISIEMTYPKESLNIKLFGMDGVVYIEVRSIQLDSFATNEFRSWREGSVPQGFFNQS